MHKGYELLSLPTESFNNFDSLYKSGLIRYDSRKSKIKTQIDSFVKPDGHLDGSKMQANWFPQITADIFISHSHADKKLAVVFSQWLYKNFGLEVFIDSCIWGHADKLLEMIDKRCCFDSKKGIYDYKKRNFSTSHVHMILSTALSMMIDNAECIIFLNTPNSITPNDVINGNNGITKSPWIYSEIAMTRLIRQKPLDDYRKRRRLMESATEVKTFSISVDYSINTEHLHPLCIKDLNQWEKKWQYYGKPYSNDYKEYALSELYKITLNNK